MRHAFVLVAAAAAAATVSPATARRSPSVTTSSNQAIRIGRMVVNRPFGAELVDKLTLAGRYRLRGRPVFLVRGDSGGACPSRFVFVTQQPGDAPVTSAPFGTCSGAASVQAVGRGLLVTMPAPSDGDAIARFVFDGTTVSALDASNDDPASLCPSASYVDPAAQAEVLAAFERDYPARLRDRQVGKVDIDAEEMRAVVTNLACLAPWPAGEHRIPAIATPLFASRHGPAAFAALAAVAEDPASGPQLRAATRGFSAEMAYRVERREPL